MAPKSKYHYHGWIDQETEVDSFASGPSARKLGSPGPGLSDDKPRLLTVTILVQSSKNYRNFRNIIKF
jgi:hypothetical protein